MSMSNTVGATARPVANDVPVTPMLMNPVFLCRQPPFGFGDPWSWYCQRALTLGFQQLPTDVLHGTGFGSVLVAADARVPADAVSGTAMTMNAATHMSTASERRGERSRSPGEPRIHRFNHRLRVERKVSPRRVSAAIRPQMNSVTASC